MSQRAIAGKMASHQPTIVDLERGDADPRLSTLERYAASLGLVFFWQLLTPSGKPASEVFTWEVDARARAAEIGEELGSGSEIGSGPPTTQVSEPAKEFDEVAARAAEWSEESVVARRERVTQTAEPSIPSIEFDTEVDIEFERVAAASQLVEPEWLQIGISGFQELQAEPTSTRRSEQRVPALV